MQDHIFVSHASTDAVAANRVAIAIERSGHKAWIAPRDIQAGKNYPDEIVKAIETSHAVVIVLSAAANGSKFVAREIEAADRRNLPIIPYRIEAVEPGPALALFLNNRQWIDAFALAESDADEALASALGSGAGTIPMTWEVRPPKPVKKESTIWTRRMALAGAAAVLAGAAVLGLAYVLIPGSKMALKDPDKVLLALGAHLHSGSAEALLDTFGGPEILAAMKRQDAIASLVPVTTLFRQATGPAANIHAVPISARSIDQAGGRYYFGWLGVELKPGGYACASVMLAMSGADESWGIRRLDAWGPFQEPCLDTKAIADGTAEADRIVATLVAGTFQRGDLSDLFKDMPEEKLASYLATFSAMAKSSGPARRIAAGPSGWQQPGVPPQQFLVARYAFDSPAAGIRMNGDFWFMKGAGGTWRLADLPRPFTPATAP